MSKLHIVLDGERSLGRVPVYGKRRFVIPFIGVIERDDGSRDRGIGVKCPNQTKLVFHAIDSADPLVYLRAFKMLSGIWAITDSLVHDCVIATKTECWLEDFLKTNAYRNGDAYQKAMIHDAQRKALVFKPSRDIVAQIIERFSVYAVPLIKKEVLSPLADDIVPSCSVLRLKQTEAPATPEERPCYLYLEHPLDSPRRTATLSS